jgi:hypothetical protein
VVRSTTLLRIPLHSTPGSYFNRCRKSVTIVPVPSIICCPLSHIALQRAFPLFQCLFSSIKVTLYLLNQTCFKLLLSLSIIIMIKFEFICHQLFLPLKKKGTKVQFYKHLGPPMLFTFKTILYCPWVTNCPFCWYVGVLHLEVNSNQSHCF